jgi:hypothetical protein
MSEANAGTLDERIQSGSRVHARFVGLRTSSRDASNSLSMTTKPSTFPAFGHASW